MLNVRRVEPAAFGKRITRKPESIEDEEARLVREFNRARTDGRYTRAEEIRRALDGLYA